MAALSYLHLPEEDEADLTQFEDSITTLDSLPYWVHDLNTFDLSDFPPSDHPLHHHLSPSAASSYDSDHYYGPDSVSELDSIATLDLSDRENQVNFVMDLFQQRVEESRVMVEGESRSEPVLDPRSGDAETGSVTVEISSNHFEQDLGLGLEIGLDNSELDDEISYGFTVADCGDGFSVERRGSGSRSTEFIWDPDSLAAFTTFDAAFDRMDREERDERVKREEAEEDDDGSASLADVTSVRNQLDPLRVEEHSNEDFDWEQVAPRIEVTRHVITLRSPDYEGTWDTPEEGVNNWQVLFTSGELERNSDFEHYGEPYEGDDYIDTAEYDVLFGQFAENVNALVGRPPASISFVQNLPSVVVTQEDVDKSNTSCAVCKDDLRVGELAKRLPCLHQYHGECVMPWLEIRNTCPVCRYELPTDDPEYERIKRQRDASRT